MGTFACHYKMSIFATVLLLVCSMMKTSAAGDYLNRNDRCYQCEGKHCDSNHVCRPTLGGAMAFCRPRGLMQCQPLDANCMEGFSFGCCQGLKCTSNGRGFSTCRPCPM